MDESATDDGKGKGLVMVTKGGNPPVKVTDAGGFTDVRYNGRTLVLAIYVNTNENDEKLLARICEYIKDTGVKPMVAGTINEMPENGG